MQVRKIDCKLTRQRNQSSSPEKRLISLQFFIWYFLRCGNSNKKNLRAVTKTTVTTWAESHWGFESLSYSICQPKLPGTRQTLVYSFLLRSCTCLRHADDHGDLHAPGVYAYCVCVCTCKCGPCVSCGSHVIWSCPNPTVRSLQALPH